MWPFSTNQFEVLFAQQERILSNQARILKLVLAKFAECETLMYDIQLKQGHTSPIQIVLTGENYMADKILFNIVLPPKAAPDVVEREVTVKLGDVETKLNLPGDQVLVEAYEGDQGVLVEVALVDIDDQGNRSPASTASIQLTDTIAPPQPGQIGLEIFDEKFTEDDTVIADESADSVG